MSSLSCKTIKKKKNKEGILERSFRVSYFVSEATSDQSDFGRDTEPLIMPLSCLDGNHMMQTLRLTMY